MKTVGGNSRIEYNAKRPRASAAYRRNRADCEHLRLAVARAKLSNGKCIRNRNANADIKLQKTCSNFVRDRAAIARHRLLRARVLKTHLNERVCCLIDVKYVYERQL